MNSESLIQVMAAAVTVSAIALVAMTCMVFGMFKAMTKMRDELQVFLPKAENLVQSATAVVTENQQRIKEITMCAAEVAETAQKNAVRVDHALQDGIERARVQLERLELVLGDTVERVHHTVVTVNNSVLKPVREVTGVASGVKAAVKHLMRHTRAMPNQATSDEEMFI